MDREAWQATVHGVSKGQTQLSDYSTEETDSGVVTCHSQHLGESRSVVSASANSPTHSQGPNFRTKD